MIKALFKFDKNIPQDAIVIDTTSGTNPTWRYLSPFILSAPPALSMENLWQFSKVYKKHIMDIDGYPDASWYKWRSAGWANPRAVRYPMGKGVKPEYSLWEGEKLDYVTARKVIYIPEYSKNVIKTSSYLLLQALYDSALGTKKDIILLDFDAYDHQALGLSLKDVVNNPNRKCGHAFVLLSLLTGESMV